MLYVSKELKVALKMFDLDIPFVESDLKRKFRNIIKKEHPDNNSGSSDSKELSIKIFENYELLKKNICEKIDIDIPSELLRQWEIEDKDITNIYDPCPTCKGTKYEQHTISVRVDCSNCGGSGFVELKCKYCEDGIYSTRRGFKVPCKSCKDTPGLWKRVPCRECNPASFGFKRKSYFERLRSMYEIGIAYEDKQINRTCSRCFGRGKIKLDLYNPVIKKGSILI